MNAPSHRTRRIWLSLVTVPAFAAYLCSLAAWYISPEKAWVLSLFSPGFAYAWIFVFILHRFWLKIQRGVAYTLLVSVLAGLQPAHATFSAGWSAKYPVSKSSSVLRVMQWNCMQLPGSDKTFHKYKEERKAATDFIARYQPDLICLQDFAEVKHPRMHSNIALLTDTLGYAYRVLAPHAVSLQPYGFVTMSTAIFSKKPPVNQGVCWYTHAPFPEAIVWADVELKGRLVRIVSTHFTSMHFFSRWLFTSGQMRYYHKPDSTIIMSENLLLKLRHFQQQHAKQAKLLRAFLDTCRLPVVLAADLNTVPAAYIYRYVKGDLQDGFPGSKTGLGATYNYLAPNLRIDYLLNDPKLEAVAWKHFADGFFDHDHLMADYQWADNH